MRALLILLGIAVLVVIALLYFRVIAIDQTSPGMVKAPTFQANVARVSVGSENKTVEVPTIDVDRPANDEVPAR